MVSGFFSLISSVTLSTSSELSNPCDTREMDHSISAMSSHCQWEFTLNSVARFITQTFPLFSDLYLPCKVLIITSTREEKGR